MTSGEEVERKHLADENLWHAFGRNVAAAMVALIPVAIGLISWSQNINEKIVSHEVQIQAIIRETDRTSKLAERDRQEMIQRLEQISRLLEEVRQSQNRVQAQHK